MDVEFMPDRQTPRRAWRTSAALRLILTVSFVSVSLVCASLVSVALISAAPAFGAARAADASDGLTWHVATVTDGSASRWYRFVCRQNLSGADVRLSLAAEGTLSAYINGQRVVRQKPMVARDGSIQTMVFDVSPVMRDGRNCVAVELRTDQPQSVLAVSLVQQQDSQPPRVIEGEWRISESAPPAGWQQTDFNAGDWKVTAGQAVAPPNSFAVIVDNTPQPLLARPAQQRSPFQFVNEDHVVLLGATFIERAQQFGHLETALLAAHPELQLTFRNLGWDGDTVFAASRGIFDPAEVGYLRMIEQVRAEEPTVVILCYGQNEALDPQMTPDRFQQQLGRLLDDLSTTGACLVLMTPHELLPAVRPLPDASRFNPRIRQFAEIVREVAAVRNLTAVDLYSDFSAQLDTLGKLMSSTGSVADAQIQLSEHPDLQSASAARWSDNGMHFNDRGYQVVSLVVQNRLLQTPLPICRIRIDPSEEQLSVEGGRVRNLRWNGEPNTLLSFQLQEPQVSFVPVMIQIGMEDASMGWSGTVASSLSRSVEPLMSSERDDGKLLLPLSSQYASLKTAVIRKNELYFHRWRPQNITYLFGFRKHEQGNNAVEIAQFDPFVRKLEEEIQQLKQPEWRTVVITRR